VLYLKNMMFASQADEGHIPGGCRRRRTTACGTARTWTHTTAATASIGIRGSVSCELLQVDCGQGCAADPDVVRGDGEEADADVKRRDQLAGVGLGDGLCQGAFALGVGEDIVGVMNPPERHLVCVAGRFAASRTIRLRYGKEE
jgi:hypothetical protein